ncbi:lysylphosphatidylglycerol synthase transmembrane domain-containing protein [candidate division CSSED10-310 bacterium]|uniref:Lysylphosphatidylglycerol synthase transmembrane domain-containing protein n=1 Tax=candidate division CSSED10-310 bacterium TaxID=2855610 RepID=A0ABV6Z389_UNCC1
MSLKSWKFWFGIIISIIFLYLFIKDIEWERLWQIIKSVNAYYLIAVVAVNLFSFVIRALRWGYFFQQETRPPFRSLFSTTSIGFMANTVLPLRIGEIVRAVLLGKKENISKSTCLGTLVVERLFDMLAILFFFAIFIIFYSLPLGNNTTEQEYVQYIKVAGYSSGILCLVVIVVIIMLRFWTNQALALVEWLTKLIPANLREHVLHITRSFITGLNILKDGSAFFISVVLSLLLWLVIIFQTYLFFYVFDLPLGFSEAIFLLVVMAFSVMIPAAPGYVGTFHYGTELALILMAVERNTAKAFAIVAHVFSMFSITVVGFFYLWLENLSLFELPQQQFVTDPEAEEADVPGVREQEERSEPRERSND